LHQLHLGTGGGKKAGSSIVHKIFQGQVRVTTRQAPRKVPESVKQDDEENDDRVGSGEEEEKNEEALEDEEVPEIEETTADSQFLQLTLDIPEKPLFRDEDGGLVIPQEPLSSVLKKFDGISFFDAVSRSGNVQRKKYQLLKLPDYLILHLARFKTNRYSREKNPAIVMFPVKNLDLSDYVFPPDGKQVPPTEEQVRSMSVSCDPANPSSTVATCRFFLNPSFPSFILTFQVKELKEMLSKYGKTKMFNEAVEKNELVEMAVDFAVKRLPDLLADKYDLVANTTHESPADVGREGKHDPLQEGSYKCHVQHRGTNQWYEMQDLHAQEIMAQQIGLSESYVLIFERKSAAAVRR
jgi:U4/U6.U5 tri-snRNP-associated protein 2